MALCVRLEASLTSGCDTRSSLLDALLSETLGESDTLTDTLPSGRSRTLADEPASVAGRI
jgi:hypothetical protein